MDQRMVLAFALLGIVTIIVDCRTVSNTLETTYSNCRNEQNSVPECLKRLIAALRPIMRNGNEQTGIETLDPAFVERTNIYHHENSVVIDGSGSLVDFTVVGMSRFDVANVAQNSGRIGAYAISMNFPQIKILGSYIANATVLGMKMESEGPLNVTLNNVVSHYVIYLARNEDGQVELASSSFNFDFDNGTINAANVIRDNPEFTRFANMVMSDNLNLLLQTVKPQFHNILAGCLDRALIPALASLPERFRSEMVDDFNGNDVDDF